jgi:hypothetical protein
MVTRSYTPLEESKQSWLEQNICKCLLENNLLIRKAAKLILVSIVARKGIVKSDDILRCLIKCMK